MNVLHGGHHDAEKYNPTILFVVVFILVSSSIADNTYVDELLLWEDSNFVDLWMLLLLLVISDQKIQWSSDCCCCCCYRTLKAKWNKVVVATPMIRIMKRCTHNWCIFMYHIITIETRRIRITTWKAVTSYNSLIINTNDTTPHRAASG